MPVLLLAQGDQAAKAILRRAVEARYGARPPALDSLEIEFKGRARAKVGPVATWVPMDMRAYFRFPTAMRWDFTVKPMKLPVQRGVESFDGTHYHTVRGGTTKILTGEEYVRSMRLQLWGVAAIMLTPLSDMFVHLEATGHYSFIATNTKLNDAVEVFMRLDDSLDHVQVKCLNPDTSTQQMFIIRLSEDLASVDEFLLPAKIAVSWDDTPRFELEPVVVRSNPPIADAVFTLEGENGR